MKILFLSVEVSPFAKVGGLADVAGSLPIALKALGHDVRIVMPAYRMILDDPRWSIRSAHSPFPVELSPLRTKLASLAETTLGGVPVYLLGTDEWFSDAVDSSTIYRPGIDQYLFYSCGALETVRQLDWTPDVVHCNDWHTGFVPVVMREKYPELWDRVACAMTIHNLAYQGEFGTEILDAVGLPISLYNLHQVEANGRVNFLKSGCAYSDRVNTVSERYAAEVQTPQFGSGLDGFMRHLAEEGRFSGILNGIDTEVFNPDADPLQAVPFSAKNPSGKSACRAALLKRLKLQPMSDAPVLGVVTRLSHQKGVDLLVESAPELFRLPVQLIVQGIGDANLAAALRTLRVQYPKHVRFVEEFDPTVAQQIYGGADAFLMPSLFEPCGLGQMIAMRYGTVPIVRRTGGLADTVFEGTNGFTFDDPTSENLIAAVSRAKKAFSSADRWRKLSVAGMRSDFSWRKSALDYVRLYEAAIGARRDARKTA